MNTSSTNSVEKEAITEEIKPDYEDTIQLDVSRSVCYGLTWTPSRDEKLSSPDASPCSLSSSPRILNNPTINDTSPKYSLSNKSYELYQLEDSPNSDQERCLEILKKLSTRSSTAVSSSKDLDSIDYWLSGEKFFKTPPKNYNDEEDDMYTIPTRDKNDSGDNERTKDKEHRYADVALDLFKLSSGNVKKTLTHNDFKTTKDTSDLDNTMNKIRRSSSTFSQSHMEGNVMQTNVHDPFSRTMVENVTSSNWNVLESVATLGRTNVHNHIYLSTGYLDRLFDIPLSKFLKLSRRNARVRCIRRRILKRPKRSRSHLVCTAYRVGSMLEMQSVNSNKRQKGRTLPKKNVCDVLAEIDTELSANLTSVERLREQLPSCIPIDTVFTSEIKRTLNEVAKRCKDWIRNSNDREKAIAKMDDRLIKTVYDLLDVIKREKYALLQEEQYYTQLQSVSIQGRQDFQKIKRLKTDADQILSNGFRVNRSDWKTLAKKLLNDTLTLVNEICMMEDNKENIKKPTNRKIIDRDPIKRPFITKLDGKGNPIKKEKLFSTRKENQVDTQVSLLSKAQPTMSIGKFKINTRGPDSYRDRIKMKEIGEQRDRILKQNEDRAEKQSLGKTMRSVHTVLTNFGNRINTGGSLEYPTKTMRDKKSNGRTNTGASLEYSKAMKDRRIPHAGREKDNTITSPINTGILNDPAKQLIDRRKRQISNSTPQRVWKPGGAFNTTMVLHAESSSRRAQPIVCDKENPDLIRSVLVKHANPSEPTAPERNVHKENRKSVHFQDERVTKLCSFLAQVKMQKGSKSNANVLSETRSSTYTNSEIPLSDTSRTKTSVKSSEVNLSRQNSVSKSRPGVHRSISNNKNYPNYLQRDTRTLFEAKSETLSPKTNFTDKLEDNNSLSKLSIKSNEKNTTENENVPSQQNFKELTPFDMAKSSMILIDDKDKLKNVQPSKATSNELIKNPSHTDLMSRDPQKGPMTKLTSNNAVNTDYDLPSDSGPSFVSVIDASCNAELNSTSNSTTMIPSSKCCQVSLSSSSSTTYLNYDQPYNKNQFIASTPTIEKDSLESSTDDESNYQATLNSDLRKRKNKHDLSFNSLKDFLHDLEIGADLIQEIEKHYKLKNQKDRQKFMKKLNETSLGNVSKDFIPNIKSPVVKTSIGSELDNQLPKKYEFKSDSNRSTDSIGSSDYSINICMEKINESILERKKSKSSQTITHFKEFCDAYTDAEVMKTDCSTYVDATVSCHEKGLKKTSKDAGTEIFAEDKSILSPRRMVETQTNPQTSSIDNVVKLANEEVEKKDNLNDQSMETIFEQSYYENKNNISHDASKSNHEKSFECLLNSQDGVTIDKSPMSQCLIHRLEDIEEQLQNVGAQLNKLKNPPKETSDAFSQISTITSIVPESTEISTTSVPSGISKESFEEFNMDFMETKNCISSDIIEAFQKIEWYASNWNEAIRLYREYSNVKRFEESDKGSTSSSTSDEAVNVSEKDKFIDCDIPASCEFVNEESYYLRTNGKTEVDSEKTSCLFERSSNVLNENKLIDFSDESDETKSLPSFGFENFYSEEMTKSTSSRGSMFFETQDKTDKVPSSISIKDGSSAMMKHSERNDGSSENVQEQVVCNSSDFVLSKEALLLLTYLTICAFVFCCLKFSMTCESLIL